MDGGAPAGAVDQGGPPYGKPLRHDARYYMPSILDRHPEHYADLEGKGDYLNRQLTDVLKKHNIEFRINQVGSMISLFFTDQKVKDFKSAESTAQELFSQFFHAMLKRGIYLPPSPFESWFIAHSTTQEMLDKSVEAADASLAEIIG